MALQEQRKSAEFQYMAQKKSDVTELVETEQKMEDAIAHYDQVASDLNTEKSTYAELALQLQGQSEQLLSKLQEHDRKKADYTKKINALAAQFSKTKKDAETSKAERAKYQKQVSELLEKLEKEKSQELESKKQYNIEKAKETQLVQNMT